MGYKFGEVTKATVKDQITWRCTNKRMLCKATVFTTVNNNGKEIIIRESGHHNHPAKSHS